MSPHSLANEPLTRVSWSLYCDKMDWHTIRSAFIKARGSRTQEDIAANVKGLTQGAIAKLESNDNLGPTVGTFIKAVEGLGIPVSSFFAEIENRHATGNKAELPTNRQPEGGSHDRAVQAQTPVEDERILNIAARIVRIVIEESARVTPISGRTQKIGGTKPGSKTPARKSAPRFSDKS